MSSIFCTIMFVLKLLSVRDKNLWLKEWYEKFYIFCIINPKNVQKDRRNNRKNPFEVVWYIHTIKVRIIFYVNTNLIEIFSWVKS